jgi:hypothetical protein
MGEYVPVSATKEENMTHESDISYQIGGIWVLADRRHSAYTVYVDGVTAAKADSSYQFTVDGLSLAKARVDYMARRQSR